MTASLRDLEVLRGVGRFRMLTRPQLKRWFFAEVSDPVVTRTVARLTKKGALGAVRLGGNGVQVVWLTKRGTDLLASHDVATGDLFPANGPAAAKDFGHTVEIANAALWLESLTPAPQEVVPAWHLQRMFKGRLVVVPDLLAIWTTPAAALAVEIDLGTEPVVTVLVPKLKSLGDSLTTQFADALRSIVIFVPGERRAKSLREAVPDLGMAVAVQLLNDIRER